MISARKSKGNIALREFFSAFSCILFLTVSYPLDAACASDAVQSTAPTAADHAVGAAETSTAPATQSGAIQWVIVVRHAEKAREPVDDPPLTPAGEERAQLLRRMLSELHPQALVATELIRSQLTLEPIAQDLGILVDVHDSDDPYGMAEKVIALNQPISVVAAHGDTVVPILEGLTGQSLGAFGAIAYDDLFIVARVPGGPASVMRLQYGAED